MKKLLPLRHLARLLAVLALFFSSAPLPVLASAYGSDNYGQCQYGQGCQQSAPQFTIHQGFFDKYGVIFYSLLILAALLLLLLPLILRRRRRKDESRHPRSPMP